MSQTTVVNLRVTLEHGPGRFPADELADSLKYEIMSSYTADTLDGDRYDGWPGPFVTDAKVMVVNDG